MIGSGEDRKTIVENMELYFGEYMAGGFDEKWIKDEAKEIFDEVEGLMMQEEPGAEVDYPDELLERWAALGGGVYK